MSADGSVELVFAGDLRKFRLGIAELIALQESRRSGPLEIAARLELGNWMVEDIIEVHRIGLIGGGEKTPAAAVKARELVAATVAPPHIITHVLTARAVILSAIQGVPEDPVGKPRAAAKAAPSPRPISTKRAPRSDSRRSKSAR